MAIPSTYYIRYTGSSKLQVISDVTAMKRGKWMECRGTYRDGSWAPGTAQILASGTPSSQQATVPVAGLTNNAAASTTGYTQLRHAITDEQLNLPPRFHWYLETGWIFAIGGDSIPAPTTVLSTATFSASNTTDELTLVSHPLANLDKVTASIGTHGFSQTEIYTVVRLTANTIKLLKSNGEMLDVTTGVVSVTLTVVDAAPLRLDNLDGLILVKDSDGPRISTQST